MAGLVPAIRVFFCRGDNKDVDGRDKPGHDGTTTICAKQKGPGKTGALDISQPKSDQRE
jgi:hypothetical protein